jgi:hypothetical protein
MSNKDRAAGNFLSVKREGRETERQRETEGDRERDQESDRLDQIW